MDPAALRGVLLEWLQVLEQVLGVEEPGSTSGGHRHEAGPREERWRRESLQQQESLCCSSSGEHTEPIAEEHPDLPEKENQGEGDKVAPEFGEDKEEKKEEEKAGAVENTCLGTPEPIRVEPPTPLPSELLGDLTPLATLYLEMSCFRREEEEEEEEEEHVEAEEEGLRVLGVAGFLRRYFFLLDAERVRRTCLLCHKERPEVQSAFIEAMQGQKNTPAARLNLAVIAELQLNGKNDVEQQHHHHHLCFSPSTQS